MREGEPRKPRAAQMPFAGVAVRRLAAPAPVVEMRAKPAELQVHLDGRSWVD